MLVILWVIWGSFWESFGGRVLCHPFGLLRGSFCHLVWTYCLTTFESITYTRTTKWKSSVFRRLSFRSCFFTCFLKVPFQFWSSHARKSNDFEKATFFWQEKTWQKVMIFGHPRETRFALPCKRQSLFSKKLKVVFQPPFFKRLLVLELSCS